MDRQRDRLAAAAAGLRQERQGEMNGGEDVGKHRGGPGEMEQGGRQRKGGDGDEVQDAVNAW
ncbi:MAG: hypothetical protein H0U85_07730 [Gemmatimonadales bacterium]|nr:hypothetical protein [Gemmatimonadales bacterium]